MLESETHLTTCTSFAMPKLSELNAQSSSSTHPATFLMLACSSSATIKDRLSNFSWTSCVVPALRVSAVIGEPPTLIHSGLENVTCLKSHAHLFDMASRLGMSELREYACKSLKMILRSRAHRVRSCVMQLSLTTPRSKARC
jgi:hypothetical protein